MHCIQLARTVGATLAFSLFSVTASAVVVTFDPLARTSSSVLPGDYEEAGFHFSRPSGSVLAVYGTSNPAYTGSAAIYVIGRNPTVTLSKVDGSDFTLHSIDLSEKDPGSSLPYEVVFTGYFSDSNGGFGGYGFWTEKVVIDGTFGNQTFDFGSYFSGVVSVEIAARGRQSFQFDNLVLGPPPAEVPEPGSIGLVGLALFGALAASRRGHARRRAQPDIAAH